MIQRLVLDLSGPTFSPTEQLTWERELLGIYLSQNPLEDYQAYLSSETTPVKNINPGLDGREVIVGGRISDLREITTKNGSKMAFVKIEDMTGELELVFFPKVYAIASETIKRDQIIITKGKIGTGRGVDRSSEEPKVLVDEIRVVSFDQAKNHKGQSSSTDGSQRLYIRLEDSDNQPLLMSLKEKLDNHHGLTEVVLVTGPKDSKQVIKLPQTIDVNESSLRDLASMFGSTNVVIR